MNLNDDKKKLIQTHERELAVSVSSRVIEKPKLTIWMILVPVIFVYFFYRLQKYSEGRKEFAEQFLISRQRALDEAFSAVQSGKPPDSIKLCRMSSVPTPIYAEYRAWLDVLIEHYMELLMANGENIFELIRGVYKNKTNYLLFINQLNTVEKIFNGALIPHLPESIDGGQQIMSLMETCCDDWRRQQADLIFKTT